MRRRSLAGLALVAYLAVAVVVGLLPSITPITRQTLVGALAFSPSDLVAGKLWLLPLSGVIVDGQTWAQLAVLAEVAVVLVVMAGARTFWRAALLAHVGSTLVAYALLGVVQLAEPSATGDLFRDPDYGVSCVWAGSVGALAVVAARRCTGLPTKVAVAAAVSAPLLALLSTGFVTPAGTMDLATVEHLFGFLLGAVVGWAATRRGPASEVTEARHDGRAARPRQHLSVPPGLVSRFIPPRRTGSAHEGPVVEQSA
jgi:hypothetical protein